MDRSLAFFALVATLVVAGLPSVALEEGHLRHALAQDNDSLAPFVPTPQDVVNRMLELAGVTEDDVVYDLGCGDGRIVITAAERFGARRGRYRL